MSTLHIYDEAKERREQLLAAALKKRTIYEFQQVQKAPATGISNHPLLLAMRSLVKSVDRWQTTNHVQVKSLRAKRIKG
jgi:hypothetical protein